MCIDILHELVKMSCVLIMPNRICLHFYHLLIMLLFKHGMTALHHACQSGRAADLVKLLIERGGDVMARDEVSNDVMCAYM